MKRRLFGAFIAALIALSAIAASLSSCNNYDPTKIGSDTSKTTSKAPAVSRDDPEKRLESKSETEKRPESVSETEKRTETVAQTETETEAKTETETEAKTETETEAQTEEAIEVRTLEDAALFLEKALSDASIDFSHYEIDNEDAQYSSYSAFTLKEAFKPLYSTDSNVHLLGSGTIRIAGDTDMRLGMKIEDLVNQGWTFNYKDPESLAIPAYSEGMGTFTKGPAEFDVDIYNNGEETIGYEDGLIVRVGFKQYEADYKHGIYKKTNSANEFVLDNRVTDVSSLNDVLLSLGAPDSISYFIDPDSRKLSTVKVCYLDLGAGIDDSDWSTEYIELIFSCDGSFIVEFSIMG